MSRNFVEHSYSQASGRMKRLLWEKLAEAVVPPAAAAAAIAVGGSGPPAVARVLQREVRQAAHSAPSGSQ